MYLSSLFNKLLISMNNKSKRGDLLNDNAIDTLILKASQIKMPRFQQTDDMYDEFVREQTMTTSKMYDKIEGLMDLKMESYASTIGKSLDDFILLPNYKFDKVRCKMIDEWLKKLPNDKLQKTNNKRILEIFTWKK